ncbi:MarR family winged helix-turn-helix transcriptional regulator [Devosia sp.]|uniref:MarR family winged helix-turn-helix transcriptional regulator n=1 Tax=Devosia sp. TaxID=1871048 RepID=UPI0032676B20
MDREFDQCLVLNTRMAARAITRRYDRRLRPFGITAAQFTILNSIASSPDRSVTDLAQSIAMERSTLSRNLDVLARKQLVERHDAAKGNGRVCALTEAGRVLAASLVPEWRKAQAELRDALAPHSMDETVSTLRLLASL